MAIPRLLKSAAIQVKDYHGSRNASPSPPDFRVDESEGDMHIFAASLSQELRQRRRRGRRWAFDLTDKIWRTLKLWRTSDFKCLESVSTAHDEAINDVTLSHDGTFVYTGSADKKIKVWTWKKDKSMSVRLVKTLEKHKSAVNALAFNTDVSVLYSSACNRSILVWERNGGADGVGGGGDMVVVGALRGHTKAVLCLSVEADLVCSGSADYSVRVWRKLSSELVGDYRNKSYCCLAVLEGHRRPVKCLTAAVDNTDSCLHLLLLVL